MGGWNGRDIQVGKQGHDIDCENTSADGVRRQSKPSGWADGKTEKRAIDLLVNHDVTRKVVNEPNMNKASFLLGVAANLGLDEDAENGEELQVAPWQASSAARPVGPQPGGGEDDTKSESHSGFISAMDSLRLRAMPPPSQATAKALPKTKAKAGLKRCSANAGLESILPGRDQDLSSRGGGTPQPENLDPKRPKRNTRENVENLDPALLAPKSTKIMEEDEKWAVDMRAKVVDLLVSDPREPDNEFKGDVSEHLKKVGEVLKTLKGRRRTVKRRAPENQEPALEQAQELEDVVDTFSELLKNLCKPMATPADEMCCKMESLASFGCKLGKEIFVRIARVRWQDDLKFKRWNDMVDKSLEWAQSTLPTSGMTGVLFSQQMSVALQKLVKNISIEKVPWLMTHDS